MAFIPLIGGLKAEMKFLKNGQLVVNVYHFTYPDPLVTADLTALAVILKNAWNTHMRPVTANTMTLDEIVVTSIETDTGLQVTYADGLPLTGTATGDDLPSNVAVCISNRSGLIGRSQRGRTYIAGMVSSAITGNTVGSGLQTAYVAYHTEILEETLLADFSFGVASYEHEGAPRTEAQFTIYNSFQVENITDSQRRRLPGRGT